MPRVQLTPEQRAALASARNQPSTQFANEPVQLTNFEEDETEREIRHTKALDLELAARLRQIRANVAASRGLAVDQAVDNAKQALTSAWQEVAGHVRSPSMRELLRNQFDRRTDLLQYDLSGHVARERDAARRENALQLQAIAQQDAIESATRHSLETHLKTVENAIDEQALIDNIEPVEVAASKRHALRSIATGRAIHLIDTDQFDEAAAWYRMSEGLLSDTDRAAIEAHLQQTSLRRAVDEEMPELIEEPVPDATERTSGMDIPTEAWLVGGKGGTMLDLGEASAAERADTGGSITPGASLPSTDPLQAIAAKEQNRPSSGTSTPAPKGPQGKSSTLIPLKRHGKGSIAFGFVARATDPAAAQWLNDHVRQYGFGPTKLKPIVDNFYNNDLSDKHAMSRNAAYIAIAMGQRDSQKFDNALQFGRALAKRIGIDADMQKDPPKKFDKTTSAALISARASISSMVSAKTTSASARDILRDWMTGKGPSYRYFGPESRETRELLNSNKDYYRELFDFVIDWLANGKYKTGDLRDGYGATSVVHEDFGAITGMKGLADGAQMEDVIGTPKYGIDLYVKGGHIYYTMANDMDLSSFSGGNVLGTEVYLPKEGQPFSRIHMIFQWSEPIPPRLRPKK